MSIDLNALSAKQLDVLISQAKQRKTRLGKRKPIAAVRKKVTALAKSEGYSIAELFGTGPQIATAPKARKRAAKKTGKPLGKVAPKYRNPANATETWAGRGKQPRWLAAETAKGRKLEDFLIK